MGGGIAQVAAVAGSTVVLADISRELAQRAKGFIDKMLSKQVKKGRLAETEKAAILERINVAEGIAKFADVDRFVPNILGEVLSHRFPVAHITLPN